jgi:hypothetical protein
VDPREIRDLRHGRKKGVGKARVDPIKTGPLLPGEDQEERFAESGRKRGRFELQAPRGRRRDGQEGTEEQEREDVTHEEAFGKGLAADQKFRARAAFHSGKTPHRKER